MKKKWNKLLTLLTSFIKLEWIVKEEEEDKSISENNYLVDDVYDSQEDHNYLSLAVTQKEVNDILTLLIKQIQFINLTSFDVGDSNTLYDLQRSELADLYISNDINASIIFIYHQTDIPLLRLFKNALQEKFPTSKSIVLVAPQTNLNSVQLVEALNNNPNIVENCA